MSTAHGHHVQSVLTALKAAEQQELEAGKSVSEAGAGIRFITISRQAGAGAKAFAEDLAHALDRHDPHGAPWTVWDHALVERVSADHNLPRDLVESLEDQSHPWLSECLEALSTRNQHSDFAVYRRVALTIRALAQAGRAIIVGRGSQFVTEGMPGALHLRMIAPLAQRMRLLAERERLSPELAEQRVREIEANRVAFYKRYWPQKTMDAEAFSLTLNSGKLSRAQMVDSVAALVGGGTCCKGDAAHLTAHEAHLQHS